MRALYLSMMARPDGFPHFEMDTERFFVGDDCLAMDGTLRREARGHELGSLGKPLPPGTSRDGLMCGEDTYFDAHASVEPLDEP